VPFWHNVNLVESVVCVQFVLYQHSLLLNMDNCILIIKKGKVDGTDICAIKNVEKSVSAITAAVAGKSSSYFNVNR